MLVEQSLVELRARHAQMLEDEERYLEQQRELHRQEKERKQAALYTMARRHEIEHQKLVHQRNTERDMKRTERLRADEEQASALQESQVAYQQKRQGELEERRREALRLAEDLRARQLQSEYYSAERRMEAKSVAVPESPASRPANGRRSATSLAETLALVQSTKAKRIAQSQLQLQQQSKRLPTVGR